MKDYFEDYWQRDTANSSSPKSCHILECLKGSFTPDRVLDPFTENIAGTSPTQSPVKNEFDNLNQCLSIAPVALEKLPPEYNLFDSKQTIANQLMQHMLAIGMDRNRVKKDNLYLIESDILKCHNQLLEMERFYLSQNKAADQRRQSIDQHLFDLYREQRSEEASCWRDQLWLKRDLILALKEYLDIERRKNLINEIMEGDYSTNQDHY